MTVTDQLLLVFQVDKQLRGLQTGLRSAERFLDEQTRLLGGIADKEAALDTQIKQLAAKIAERESEAARLEARLVHLRTQMDSATTNKEFKAFLTEVNTLKVEKEKVEAETLEHMTKVEDLRNQLAELGVQKTDREMIRSKADEDKNRRHVEIKDQLTKLKEERDQLVTTVPVDAMRKLDKLLDRLGDEAMASVEILDRRAKEFSCGACRMAVPFEAVCLLYGKGSMTMCASCGCILHLEKSVAEAVQPAKR